MSFRLLSEGFNEGEVLPKEQVFQGMGFDGGNISPQLAWENAPEGTRGFVLTMYDPDAPPVRGGGIGLSPTSPQLPLNSPKGPGLVEQVCLQVPSRLATTSASRATVERRRLPEIRITTFSPCTPSR